MTGSDILSYPSVCNIKFAFELSNKADLVGFFGKCGDECIFKSHYIRKYGNFFVIRGAYVYTIFHRRGYVNVTGVKRFEDILHSIYNICQLLDIDQSLITSGVKIHTITSTGFNREPLDHSALSRFFDSKLNRDRFSPCLKRIHFNPEKFPAFTIFTAFGTALLYPHKHVFVGARSQSDLDSLHAFACSLLQDVNLHS